MSVRYCGDVEIRLGYDPRRRVYAGRVVDPQLRFRGGVPLNPKFSRDPQSSEAYDDAARRFYLFARDWMKRRGRSFDAEEKGGRPVIRRVFQSPCPLE